MLPTNEIIQKAVKTLEFKLKALREQPNHPFHYHCMAHDDVLSRFQPIFHPDSIGSISADEFRSFLVEKNNKHWSGLQRMGPAITEDMNKLREALTNTC